MSDGGAHLNRTAVRDVLGFCPQGCGQTLHVMATGAVLCLHRDCPDPQSVHTILSGQETEHTIRFTNEVWTVLHPLRERAGDALEACPVSLWVSRTIAQHPERFPVKESRWRLLPDGAGAWAWEPLEPGGKP
jgi:hypothetical protein